MYPPPTSSPRPPPPATGPPTPAGDWLTRPRPRPPAPPRAHHPPATGPPASVAPSRAFRELVDEVLDFVGLHHEPLGGSWLSSSAVRELFHGIGLQHGPGKE